MGDPLIGAVVGERYRLTEAIGAGGMATVYRGEHMLLHKPVAVKVLLPELTANESMAARFEREAIAAAKLEHPNIVAITDFGRTPDGRLFLVMEFLEGTPLSDLISDELHLGWERAVEITRQVLRGLAHAHEVGVVHRDLKPSNVMVMPQAGGREIAKIIDFGIAKILGGSNLGPHVETEAGIVFGTADFLAPERLSGKGESDPRADVYSAGIILYEALTGERPFHDDDVMVTVERALKETARPPSQVVPGIPVELDAVVARALVKNPEGRYPSARAMLNGLDPFARQKLGNVSTTGGRALPPPPRLPLEERRRPVAAGELVAADATPLPPPMPLDGAGFDAPAPLSTTDDVFSGMPLLPYVPPPDRRRRLLWLVPLAAVAIVVVAAVTSRGGVGTSGVTAIAPPALARPEGGSPADPQAELKATIEQAAEGETIEERQRAFDRLVALGYSDRVPWVAMLSKDLEQAGSCEDRREIVAKLKKIRDPAALPALRAAGGRSGNECLAGDARAAIAALGGETPEAPVKAAEAPTSASPPPARKRPRGSGGGGGHF